MVDGQEKTGLANKLILSAGTLPNATFVDRVKAASEAGFDGISLFPQQYLSAIQREKLSPLDMRHLLLDWNISVEEVDPLLDWFSSAGTPAESLMLDIADQLGARSVNAPTAFISNRSQTELLDYFGSLCERMHAYELRVDLEFLPWTQITNLEMALSFVEEVRQPNAGVMLDCWHFWHSGGTTTELRSLSPERAQLIRSIQLSDQTSDQSPWGLRDRWYHFVDTLKSMKHSIEVLGWERVSEVILKASYPVSNANELMMEAQSQRLFPGEGSLPLSDWLEALIKKGVCCTLGIEVFNLRNSRQPARMLANQAMNSCDRLLKPRSRTS